MTITAKQRMPTPRAWCSDHLYSGPAAKFAWATDDTWLLSTDMNYTTMVNGDGGMLVRTETSNNAFHNWQHPDGTWNGTQWFVQYPTALTPDDTSVSLRITTYGAGPNAAVGGEAAGWEVQCRLVTSDPFPVGEEDWIAAAQWGSYPLLASAATREHDNGHLVMPDEMKFAGAAVDAAFQAAKAVGQPLRVVFVPAHLVAATPRMQAASFFEIEDTYQAGKRRPRVVWTEDVTDEIFVIGDHNVLYYTAPSNEVFSPATNTWRMAMGAGDGWEGSGGFRIGLYIYHVSGTRIVRYDIENDTWTYHLFHENNVSGRFWNAEAGDAVSYGGKGYMTNTYGVYEYDPTANTMTKVADWPANTVEGGAWGGNGGGVALDGDWMYVAGSQLNNHYTSQRFVRWHIPTNTWEVLPRIPIALDYCTAAIMDRRFVVVGRQTAIFSYPIDEGVNGSWRWEGDKPQFGHLQAACYYGGGIYIFGGEDGAQQVWGDQYGKMWSNWFFTWGNSPDFVGTPLEGGGGTGPSLRRPGTSNPPSSTQASVRSGGRNTYL